MRAKREVHRLSEYLIEGAPSTQNPFHCPFEQTIAGISISIHFRTVVANFNNLKTHPVCNLFSTNEINPSENIFNNNVMQNRISKIVKSWRFTQFFLKSGRLQPPLHGRRGYTIRRYTPIHPGTEELLLSSRKVHPPVFRQGGRGLKCYECRGTSKMYDC